MIFARATGSGGYAIRSRRRPGRVHLLVLLASLAIIAAACGTGSTSATTSSSFKARGPAGTPKHGGSLIVATLYSPFGLDPLKMIGGVTDGVVGQAIYDSLMTFNASGNPVPWLATSMTSPTGQTWTMQLHQGVMFQDGTPFNAAAVVFNIERQMNPANHSLTGYASAENIASVDATGPYTVVFHLKFPWQAFPDSLTGPLGLMASPTAVQKEGANYNSQPVGTGPFEVVQYLPGDSITLKRNPHYWIKGEPYLNQITFRTIVNAATRLSSIETDEVQVDQTIDPTEVEAAHQHGLQTSYVQDSNGEILMNNQVAPFNNVNMRLAIRYATNTTAINKILYNGEAGPAWNAWISPSSPYYDKNVTWPSYDLAKAKALVKAYVAQHGPVDITFSCYNDPPHLKLGPAVQQMWDEAGFHVTLNVTTQDGLVIDMLEGHYQIGCLANQGYPNPDQTYYAALYSTSPSNYLHYSNPAVDAALTRGRESTSLAVRKAAYDVVQEHLASDMPAFTTQRDDWGWIAVSKVGGVQAEYGGSMRAGALWLK